MIELSAPDKSGYTARFGSIEEAQAKAASILGITEEDMIERESPDGGTTYYYASEAEAEADADGAYAVQSCTIPEAVGEAL